MIDQNITLPFSASRDRQAFQEEEKIMTQKKWRWGALALLALGTWSAQAAEKVRLRQIVGSQIHVTRDGQVFLDLIGLESRDAEPLTCELAPRSFDEAQKMLEAARTAFIGSTKVYCLDYPIAPRASRSQDELIFVSKI